MGETGEGLTFNMITTLHLTPLMPWRRCCTRAATTIQTDKKTTDQIFFWRLYYLRKNCQEGVEMAKTWCSLYSLAWPSIELARCCCSWYADCCLLGGAGAVLSQSALLLPLAGGGAEHARCRSQLLIASICSNTNNFTGNPFQLQMQFWDGYCDFINKSMICWADL